MPVTYSSVSYVNAVKEPLKRLYEKQAAINASNNEDVACRELVRQRLKAKESELVWREYDKIGEAETQLEQA